MTSAASGAENRAACSVFIGNVPLDVTEDQLKDLFSEVGFVINFRLFCDKTSGASKGFAFCEYKEPELAISATRNLGNFKLKGQNLQVELATSEKCRQELERLQSSIIESVAENTDNSEKAPEEISKAVASLPAEQMFELMKQMKMCIENNPQEARNLLLQNPQLAYALLQAQVIMRIVDPDVAMKILNRPTGVSVPSESLNPDAKPPAEQTPVGVSPLMPEAQATMIPVMPTMSADPMVAVNPVPVPRPVLPAHIGAAAAERPPMMPTQMGPIMPNQFADQDLCVLRDQDLRQLPMTDHDLRVPPPILSGDKDMRQPLADQDLRNLQPPAPESRPFDPRFRNIPPADISHSPVPNFERSRQGNLDPRTAFEARNVAAPVKVEDPRKASMAALNSARVAPGALPPNLSSAIPGMGLTHPTVPGAPEDQEKAALILQVLQLTDQQISVLPPEQRQSILVLKEQLARSQLA